MTRNEALKRMRAVTNVDNTTNDQHYMNFMNCLVALGLLNLDEENLVYDFASEALEGHSLYCKSVDLKRILDRAGLKIVEK